MGGKGPDQLAMEEGFLVVVKELTPPGKLWDDVVVEAEVLGKKKSGALLHP